MIKNKHLIKYRIQHQLSQAAMAKKIGIPLRTYQSYENMVTETAHTLQAFMDVINE